MAHTRWWGGHAGTAFSLAKGSFRSNAFDVLPGRWQGTAACTWLISSAPRDRGGRGHPPGSSSTGQEQGFGCTTEGALSLRCASRRKLSAVAGGMVLRPEEQKGGECEQRRRTARVEIEPTTPRKTQAYRAARPDGRPEWWACLDLAGPCGASASTASNMAAEVLGGGISTTFAAMSSVADQLGGSV